MPIVHIRSNIKFSATQTRKVLLTIAQTVSNVLQKPFADVMISFDYMEFLMNGTTDAALHADITCLSGLSTDTQLTICNALRATILSEATIDCSRIYLHFHKAIPDHSWRFINEKAVCQLNGNHQKCEDKHGN